MEKKLSMAVVGVGMIGMTHALAMSQADNVHLAAVVEPNEELGRKVAAQFGCDYLPSVAALKDRPDIDAVNICVPEEYHLSTAVEAARLGKHIMLEKPIAKTAAEAEQIAAAARENNVRLMVAHTCHFIGQYRKIKNEYDAGKLGEISQININRFTSRASMDRLKGRVSILYYVAIHDLDAVQWITGHKIVAVSARKVDTLKLYGEDGYAILFEMDNGACGVMSVGWQIPANFPGGVTRLTFVGDKGLIFYNMTDEGIQEFVTQLVPVSPTIGMLDGRMVGAYADEVRHFADAVLNEKEFWVDTDSVIYSVRVVEAVMRAAEFGRMERV